MQRFHQSIGDLHRQVLLDLEPSREHVNNPRRLRQANDFAVRYVSNMRFADEWNQMVLTQRIEFNVFDQNDLAGFGLEKRIVD